jgi:hypothetical protein
MEADPIDEKSKISKSQVDIHPDAAVVSKAILKGNITIGPGTIVHPQVFSFLLFHYKISTLGFH